MQMTPFPAHYQSVYTNFDFSSFSRISCAPISAILPRNMAEISAQSGWGCFAIWLGLDCNKAEGGLPLMRPDFTWPCPPVHRAGH